MIVVMFVFILSIRGRISEEEGAYVMNHSCIHYWLAIQWDDTWNICVRGRRGRGETLTREKQELLLSIALCVCPLTCQRSPHPTHPPYDASVSFFVRYTTTLNDYAESLQPPHANTLPMTCTSCKVTNANARDAWHFLSCNYFKRRQTTQRHDAITRILHRYAQQEGGASTMEVAGLDPARAIAS